MPTMGSVSAVVGGRVFRKGRFERADIAIDGEKISIVGDIGAARGGAVLDASGLVVFPGLLDVHVHFREPGLERKEGWTTGSRGALFGGVTSVIEIQNNPPLTTTLARLHERRALVASKSFVDFGLYPNLVAESLGALADMAPFAPGFKLFMGGSTGVGGITDYGMLREFFAATAAVGRTVVVHAEEESILRHETAARPAATVHDHHRVRSETAETVSIAASIELARATGATLHIFHISTGRGADLVAQARAGGLDVSGSTSPHYLLLTHEESARLGNYIKVNPSVKSARDRDRLCERLADGTLEAIGTDHAPHPREEKELPYAQSPSGLPSVDLVLPLALEIARRGVPLERVIASLGAGAARCFGIEGKGAIEPGMDADLVLVDPEKKRVVDASELPSKSKWSPYAGWTLAGFAETVVLRGRTAFSRGAFDDAPRGTHLRLRPPQRASAPHEG